MGRRRASDSDNVHTTNRYHPKVDVYDNVTHWLLVAAVDDISEDD